MASVSRPIVYENTIVLLLMLLLVSSAEPEAGARVRARMETKYVMAFLK
jgi:hypothetical protein